jgi:hypothetical protein
MQADAGRTLKPPRCFQGCFKIGVLRTPGWEAAVGDGSAGPPPYTVIRRGKHFLGQVV